MCILDHVTNIGDSVEYHYYLLLLRFLWGFSKPSPTFLQSRRCSPPEHRRTVARFFDRPHYKPENTCLHRHACVYRRTARMCCVAYRKAVRITDAKRIANNDDEKPVGLVDTTVCRREGREISATPMFVSRLMWQRASRTRFTREIAFNFVFIFKATSLPSRHVTTLLRTFRV